MEAGRSFTLSELARDLATPQHRLIHLCEKGVVTPELGEAHGRGSSRMFSARNFLEFAIALRLRQAMLPITAIGAVLHVLRAFESQLRGKLLEFSLPESLRDGEAPDLRIIVSDGSVIYFSLAMANRDAELFGGIPLDQLTGDKPEKVQAGAVGALPSPRKGALNRFGGPEDSQFVRLEINVTEIARDLPLT